MICSCELTDKVCEPLVNKSSSELRLLRRDRRLGGGNRVFGTYPAHRAARLTVIAAITRD